MQKLPEKYFHLVFSVLMGAMMVFIMTLVITLANVGGMSDFVSRWALALAIACGVAVPVIYLLAPQARKPATRFAVDPLRPQGS